MTDVRFYGYAYQRRQPCIRLSHALKITALPAIERIDAWLRDGFFIDPEIIQTLYRPDWRQDEQQRIRAVCVRALVLYGELLRACNVPCYDAGDVVAIAPTRNGEGVFEVTVSLPLVDNIPVKFFSDLYADIIRMTCSVLVHGPTDIAIADLFGKIEETLLKTARKSSPFSSAGLALCRAAFEAGIPFRHLGGGLVRFGWGSRSRTFHHSSSWTDSAVGAALSHDKKIAADILRAAAFPAPEHVIVGSPEAAIAAMAQLGGLVVVKPADRDRSEGVTIGVTNEGALIAAYKKAQGESARVLVERQIPGVCHRILVADGRIVYAVKRNPKGVIGDGENTVLTLIDKANARQIRLPPWRRLVPTPADALAVECLEAAGLNMQAVPAAGQFAPLRPFNSNEWGGVVDDVYEAMHPDNRLLAIDVAKAFGLTFAGVDLISTDIARPWHENGAVINEVNFRPEFTIASRGFNRDNLLAVLAEGDGRVPVHLIAGPGATFEEGQATAQRLREQGRACYFATVTHAEDGQGRPFAMPLVSLFDRAVALLMRGDLDELVLVDEHLEFLARGFPVDRLKTMRILHPNEAECQKLAQLISSHVICSSPQASGKMPLPLASL